MLDLKQVLDRARRVRLAVFDVDGVFTDGRLYYTDRMMELRAFHVHDGLGIKLLLKADIQVAVTSARESELVTARMRELGVRHVYQGCHDKLEAFEKLLRAMPIESEACAYIGDDLPDLPAMQRVGLAIAVANAQPAIVEAAHWQTLNRGGEGAVREVCELLLKAQDKYDDILAKYQATPA